MTRHRIPTLTGREVRGRYAELPDDPTEGVVRLRLLEPIDVADVVSTVTPGSKVVPLDADGAFAATLPISPARWTLTGPDGVTTDFTVTAGTGPLDLTR